MYSLVGINGNAFSIMGYVTRVMKANHYSKEQMDEYVNKAMSGNYDNVIQTSLKELEILNNLNPDDEEDYR